MLLDIFPIKGPLKEPLLIIEWIIVFSFFELALIFLLRTRYKLKELKNLQEKAYIFIYFGYSFMWIFIIIADFYLSNDIYLRNLILNIGFLIQAFCALVFVYMIEKYKIFIRKFLFTKIFLLLAIIYGFLIFFFLDYAGRFSTIFWIVFSICIMLYFKALYKDFYIKRELGHIKFDFIKIIVGILITVIGYQMSTRLFSEMFGLELRLIGDIFQLIGLVFISWFLLSIPSFSEYDWQEKIDSVIIMHKSGLYMYKRSFRSDPNSIDESIITGTLTTLKLMLEKVTDREDILTIEKKGKIIIIQPGKFIYGVIICDEKLNSLQILLRRFIERIETIYYQVLKHWNGNLNVFKPLDDISKEIFY